MLCGDVYDPQLGPADSLRGIWIRCTRGPEVGDECGDAPQPAVAGMFRSSISLEFRVYDGGVEGQKLIGYKLSRIADTATVVLRRYLQHKTKFRVRDRT